MKKLGVFGTLGLGLFFLISCNSPMTTPLNATVTEIHGTTTPTKAESTSLTLTPTFRATTIPFKNTLEPTLFPLSEPGPYFVGNRVYTLVDESRNNREIELLIWYPAMKETDTDDRVIVRDAVPDMNSAPYPLILTGSNSGRYLFKSHLASHGFVMTIVRSPGFSYVAPWNNAVVRPQNKWDT